ncbi:MAG: adenosylmethionine decarboxylase [Deltaproteobacteria bacterium]|nr:MAG: adenosylmethionine decarboxylase [Deltaproteobacteria bacterium]
MGKALGRHILLELSGCPYALLNDVEYVRKSLLEAAERAQVTIISDSFNMFNPHGVSGMVIIAESHISIHTWPEYGYAAIDVFTCGDSALPERAVEYLVEAFQPEEYTTYVVKRGILREEIPQAACEIDTRRVSCAG